MADLYEPGSLKQNVFRRYARYSCDLSILPENGKDLRGRMQGYPGSMSPLHRIKQQRQILSAILSANLSANDDWD